MAKIDALQNRIAAQQARLAVLDDRVGRLMSQRVDVEEKIAALLDELAAEQAAIARATGEA